MEHAMWFNVNWAMNWKWVEWMKECKRKRCSNALHIYLWLKLKKRRSSSTGTASPFYQRKICFSRVQNWRQNRTKSKWTNAHDQFIQLHVVFHTIIMLMMAKIYKCISSYRSQVGRFFFVSISTLHFFSNAVLSRGAKWCAVMYDLLGDLWILFMQRTHIFLYFVQIHRVAILITIFVLVHCLNSWLICRLTEFEFWFLFSFWTFNQDFQFLKTENSHLLWTVRLVLYFKRS